VDNTGGKSVAFNVGEDDEEDIITFGEDDDDDVKRKVNHPSDNIRLLL
jgi:hypothetical protein